ncbi:hypothetical protein ACRALDRAFT_205680 [Sodiomyces alcalophilus JCM 7366]|uniref:uncharacterized protein n=1 Tax=Sodiomyces alcalophilus JCM 7366 TaxID=591952 RepID=UPI0039B6505A
MVVNSPEIFLTLDGLAVALQIIQHTYYELSHASTYDETKLSSRFKLLHSVDVAAVIRSHVHSLIVLACMPPNGIPVVALRGFPIFFAISCRMVLLSPSRFHILRTDILQSVRITNTYELQIYLHHGSNSYVIPEQGSTRQHGLLTLAGTDNTHGRAAPCSLDASLVPPVQNDDEGAPRDQTSNGAVSNPSTDSDRETKHSCIPFPLNACDLRNQKVGAGIRRPTTTGKYFADYDWE